MKLTTAFLLTLAISTNAFASDATGFVTTSARKFGVPVHFALKIAKIESGIRCGVHNRHSGATGPMQILPSTARHLGFRNIRGSSCATQVHAGMKYLAFCVNFAHGNLYNAARCYNAGPGGMRSRNRAVHRYASAAVR